MLGHMGNLSGAKTIAKTKSFNRPKSYTPGGKNTMLSPVFLCVYNEINS